IPDETLYEKVFGLEYEGVKKQLEQEQIYKLEQEAKVQKMQIEQNAELHLYQVEVAQKLGLPLEQSGEEENPEAQMEEFPQQEPSADGA
ncbi:hypothetical protein, partial [Lacticaseibacillus rhamnosus]|uniref:hypothetical protein n=1 Tax=Lacticaseibacillus rhamnosus TaxID=47715 RepID=UPI003F44C4B2